VKRASMILAPVDFITTKLIARMENRYGKLILYPVKGRKTNILPISFNKGLKL